MERKQSGRRPLTTRLFFHWAAVGGEDDEEVRVVGSCPELGSWKVQNAVPLRQVPADGFSCWVSKGVLVPMGTPVEYMYAFCDKKIGDLRFWEPLESNRRVVPTGRRHILEDDEGRYRQLHLESQRLASQAAADVLAPPMARQCSVAAGQEEPEPLPPPTPSALAGPRTPTISLQEALKEGSSAEFSEKKKAMRSSLSGSSLSRHLNDVPELHAEDTIFIIFKSLPLTVERDGNGQWQIGVESSNQGAVLPALLHFTRPEEREVGYDCKVRFIGSPGVNVTDEGERRQITELLAQHSCIPVFVDKEVEDNHLDFCLNFLWPVFHSQKCFDTQADEDAPSSAFDEAKWKSYQVLNNAYAEVIEQWGTSETLVWVHDYHLLLVPRYIYHRCPDWHIGFFLHSAFPGSDIIRCLPNREEILQSLLCCKLVTFQIFDYMRNFLSTVSLLLGAKHTFAKGGMMQVEHAGNNCAVSADHFVIAYEHLRRHLGKENVRVMAQNIRNKFPGKIIIGSYDRMDRFAGLSLKVRAFQKFLKEYRSYQGKVVLMQYVTYQTEHGHEDTHALFRELEQMAQETNQAFQRPGEPPVVNLFVEDLDRDKRMAVLQATDVLFDTSINDGLNLVPFQFYAAHTEDKRGVVVVSEFCGCSRVLTGVYKVNPWDMSCIMVALDQALSIEPTAQALRFAKDHSYVASQTIVEWVRKNLCELRSSVQAQKGQNQLAGHLDLESVLEAYRSAKTRAIFVDNEGTIAAKAGWFVDTSDGSMTALKREGTPPDEHVLDCLQTLAHDRNNTVVILSGRDPKCLDRWFHDVKGVGLCAEHGYHWLPPKSLRTKSDAEDAQTPWRCVASGDERDEEWKAIVGELMKQYVKRVQGSILEFKDSAIVWNYRGVGAPLLVASMARELARFLDPRDDNGVMHGYPVQVICGKGYVEVKRTDTDKGLAVARILELLTQQLKKPVDFVLCIGDDRSDEDMFEAVAKLYPEQASNREGGASPPMTGARMFRRRSSSKDTVKPKLTLEARRPSAPPGHGEFLRDRALSSSVLELQPGAAAAAQDSYRTYTVTVGRKPSKAQYYVHDVGEVSILLQKLSAQSVISSFSRFSSLPNLIAEGDSSNEDSSSLSPKALMPQPVSRES